MYIIYQTIITLLFAILSPVIVLAVIIKGNSKAEVLHRFGLYRSDVPAQKSGKRIWLHASSVGEVQAAKALITELENISDNLEFVVSTMTRHGQTAAIRQLSAKAACIFSPLDVPFITKLAIYIIKPDCYVCLETELWPSVLHSLHRARVPVLLLNGRMSERSIQSYLRFRYFFRQVLACFDRMAFITKNDMSRYLELGADKERCLVAGNVKYDLSSPKDQENHYRKILKITDQHTVFISGSTHSGEEELLLRLFQEFDNDFIWITAPRHLKRLPAIAKLMDENQISYNLFSHLKNGGQRQANLIIVDVMGELAHLYPAGDYIFCGGSLVEYGGHNLMEAAISGKAVFYGPNIHDYRDAASLLELAGAGFMVEDVQQLIEKIRYFQNNQDEYKAACRRAETAAKSQQGAARRQAEMVIKMLQ